MSAQCHRAISFALRSSRAPWRAMFTVFAHQHSGEGQSNLCARNHCPASQDKLTHTHAHTHTHTSLMPTHRALMAWSSLLSAGLDYPEPASCRERMWSPACGSHACKAVTHMGSTPQGPTAPTMTIHHPVEDGAHPASNFKPWVWGLQEGREDIRMGTVQLPTATSGSVWGHQDWEGTQKPGHTKAWNTTLVSQAEKLKFRKGEEPAEVT